MDIVVIFNGLGNQMSQYAFYLQKRQSNPNTRYILLCKQHNGLELNSIFGISLLQRPIDYVFILIFRLLITKRIQPLCKPIQRVLGKFNFHLVNENMDYKFHPQYLASPTKGITFYCGGWHTEAYFANIKPTIRSSFIFNIPNDTMNKLTIEKIQQSNSIALHVRRGDYLDASNYDLYGKVCTTIYYERAINYLNMEIQDAVFFVFSNDIKWVKENLNIPKPIYITNNNGKDSWKDMYLMSICKYNIISNSTFSWWGAWLNQNPNKKIICPTRFLNNDTYTDIYPQDWIRIDS